MNWISEHFGFWQRMAICCRDLPVLLMQRTAIAQLIRRGAELAIIGFPVQTECTRAECFSFIGSGESAVVHDHQLVDPSE